MENANAVLNDWLIRAKRKARAHRMSATHFEVRHLMVGVPSVVLLAVSGTAVVAQQTAKDPSEWKWWIVAMVLLSAVLSGLQTFLDYGSRSKQHKAKAAGYGAQRRRLQCALDGVVTLDAMELKGLMDMSDELAEDEPTIPPTIWRAVEAKYPRG